jgi:hypothetical protein
VNIDVRQDPGFSYPRPPNRAWIVEQTAPGLGAFLPSGQQREMITPGDADCGADPNAEY